MWFRLPLAAQTFLYFVHTWTTITYVPAYCTQFLPHMLNPAAREYARVVWLGETEPAILVPIAGRHPALPCERPGSSWQVSLCTNKSGVVSAACAISYLCKLHPSIELISSLSGPFMPCPKNCCCSPCSHHDAWYLGITQTKTRAVRKKLLSKQASISNPKKRSCKQKTRGGSVLSVLTPLSA